MNIEYYDDLTLYDFEPTTDTFRGEILAGLRETPKTIPSKFLYDEEGSRLFREITILDEYYPTRTEIGILRDRLPEIAEFVGRAARIIEFGTGAGLKTKLLLKALDHPALYIPIDISREQLLDASTELALQFPDLEVLPVCADYTEAFHLPEADRAWEQTVVFFPGSTVGNFVPEEAVSFLHNIAKLIGVGGSLIIGVDLVKDPKVLTAAYNDRRGITAKFNLNLIEHINREFRTNLEIASFDHYAFFNTEESRIEMHLISRTAQDFKLLEETIHLAAGEHIVTEYSYKYTVESFGDVARMAGFDIAKTWTDPDNYFSLHYCVVRTV